MFVRTSRGILSSLRRGLVSSTILPLFVLLSGCDPSGNLMSPLSRTGKSSATDHRMIAAYRELQDRRFHVLADFESSEQNTLFQMITPDGPVGGVTISTERARLATGSRSLKVSLLHSRQQAVARTASQTTWPLHRNWTDYHLFVFSVYSPRRLGGFTFRVTSGTSTPLTYRHPRILLEEGWNLIRVDLGDLSDRIDRTDVRELVFKCDPLDTPVDLYIDDLILVDNTEDVFQTPERKRGDLYVRRQGRRLAVGAVDRFELVFARGRIRQWFDLLSDPDRSRNLVGTGTLGPTPVVVPNVPGATVSLDDASQWSGLGVAVEVHQGLLEVSAVRIVVQGEWRFGATHTLPDQAAPHHRWTYTIYRDGRIYVECSGSAAGPSDPPPGLGMAFSCDGDLGFQRHIAEGVPVARHPDRPSYTLFHRGEPHQADLLVVPFLPMPIRSLANPKDSRICALAIPRLTDGTFAFAAMMRVWPNDMDSPVQAAPMAADYCQPLPIRVDVGRLVRTDPGDLDNDGFSETQGCYVLQLDGTTGRIRLDGRKRLRFSPIFKLVDIADRDVWAYADGKLIRNVYRDPIEGFMLIEVDGVISTESLIEITSRKRVLLGP